ncbi:ATP-binding protein [Actinomadura sp. GC306]|uniref:ATP-binding protein n=1 Tax=Actinomadura sp. GC306 TaxID=2530367 RepID=UPI001404D0F6|nr:ATP-binding protein [Actinomadura sp. GC306]
MAALPSAVPVARYFTRALLGSWDAWEAHGWECQQVISELVSNALDATASDPDLATRAIAMILLRFQLSAEHLIIEVRDDSPASPQVGRAALLDEGGRGLLLAATLASSWGTYALTDGKVVWAAWELAPETP